MHEMPITQSILRIALEHAERHEATRVTALNLVIGQLSSIVDDSIQFYWDIVSRDTICAGAKLNFERIPAKLLCRDCQEEFTITRGLEACPNCGGFNLQVVAGEDFRLESIEIE